MDKFFHIKHFYFCQNRMSLDLNLLDLLMEWIPARNNLKETFDKIKNIYNVVDMKNGIMKEFFI